MSETKQKTEEKLTEVVVKKPGHTHQGSVCEVGDKIKVSEAQKTFLLKHEVIQHG